MSEEIKIDRLERIMEVAKMMRDDLWSREFLRLARQAADIYATAQEEIEARSMLKEEAVKTWNTPPIEDEKDKVIARLKEKLNSLKQKIIENRDKYMKLTEHDDFTTATLAFGGYNLLNSFIEIINAADNDVGSMK